MTSEKLKTGQEGNDTYNSKRNTAHDLLATPILCATRLRVLCECGLRPFEWGSGDCSSSSSSLSASVGTNAYLKPGRGERLEASGRIDAPAAGRNNFPASQAAKPVTPAPCRLLVSVGDEDEGGDTARWLNHNAVECQRVRVAFDGFGSVRLGSVGLGCGELWRVMASCGQP